MSPLFLGLLIAGAVLVLGVVFINWLQERRVRRRIDAAFRKPADAGPGADRVEPMLGGEQTAVDASAMVDATDMETEAGTDEASLVADVPSAPRVPRRRASSAAPWPPIRTSNAW